MCGRYVSTASPEELAAEYHVDDVALDGPLPPRWNVAPTQSVYVVAAVSPTSPGVPGQAREPRPAGRDVGHARAGAEDPGSPSGGRRWLGAMRWGLVPSWAQSPAVGARMINARAETLASRPAFRSALRRRRCVVPADSFWEWRAGPGRSKQPYAIRRRGGGTLAFAGLWERWRDPVTPGPALHSVAIVTTRANRSLAVLHERMPVVLDAVGVERWLDPELEEPELLLPLLVPAPDEGWEHWPVDARVGSVANDGPELLEALHVGVGDRQRFKA